MKLFTRNCFSCFKNTLKLAYSNVETYNFSGGHTPGPPLAGRGREGMEKTHGDPPPLQNPRSATDGAGSSLINNITNLSQVTNIEEA